MPKENRSNKTLVMIVRRLGYSVFVAGSFLAGNRLTAAEQPSQVKEFIESNCLDCHDASEKAGGLDLDQLSWSFETEANRSRWTRIHDRVQAGEMPPESTLTSRQRSGLTQPIGTAIVNVLDIKKHEQGRTILRRLNRREFENSLHDLLRIDLPIEHLLPEDGRSQGFDTVAEGLRISAVQIEKYLEVIELALDSAVRLTARPEGFSKRLRMQDEEAVRKNLDTAEDHVDPVSGERHRRLFRETDDALVYISHGYSPDDLKQFAPPSDGEYRVRVSAYAVDSRGDPIALKVFSSDWKNHQLLQYFELGPEPRTLEFTASLSHRDHLRFSGYGIGIDDDGKNVWNMDSVKDWKVPGMAVQWIEIEGPLLEDWPPESVTDVFGADHVRELEQRGRWTDQGHIAYEVTPQDPASAVRQAITRFATRAFRRPLKVGEADAFIDLANAELERGRTYEQAMRVALRAILVSPRFLMLDESPGKLDGFAVASRLSYCFWSSPPDEELLGLAQAGKLSDKVVVGQQVERLLGSERGQRFVTSFVGQWLELNQIDATIPDTRLYPEYDDLLRRSMVAETELFFNELLSNNLPIASLIDCDFAMLDRRLAEHYELTEPFAKSGDDLFGEQFRRVALPGDSVRGGVMTQAAVLKVTANGTVTSPVVRGSWILRRIVGKPPSPPPPVNAIEPDTRGATTIREQLAKHRDSDTCNRCHREIDPPGFALESFDVIGGFRTRYRSIGEGDSETKRLHGRNIWEYKLGQPVDCSGQTSDGRAFADINEFRKLMLADQRQIVRSLAEKMTTYATGAGISFADRDEIEQIVEKVSASDGGLRTLVHEIATSDLFLTK
ncbi:Planctomycete cytochrome C [Rubripirellula tenax]|uniref:Planctomycete cytochrome C n=1 Tax=Rubripirellula tenax TaxID=2528015 RepID=A0A5C6F2V0_9BACT|nr:DUF1592 domain-containing protein [Rubripirellula tenax]TWU54366.1 Planctomycete cytochrome C [Rubripirellula tenax]